MSRPPLKKILYVEDDADIRTIAQLSLEVVGGFTLWICASGREALLPEAAQFGADVILLDVMMPDMDGPTTLRQLRALPQFAATPVVFMTAKVQAAELESYRALGALDVIPKPFDPMALPGQLLKIWQEAP